MHHEGIFPFFIDWDDYKMHPSLSVPIGGKLVNLSVKTYRKWDPIIKSLKAFELDNLITLKHTMDKISTFSAEIETL